MNTLTNKLKNFFSNSNNKLIKRAFIERPIRIKLLPIHNVKFEQNQNGVVQNLYLYNISSSGVGISQGSFNTSPELGYVIKGNLIIDGESFPVILIVVHLTESIVGCRITAIEQNCKIKMSQYFFHELVASKLYPLNPSILKPDPDGDQVYLTGEDRCELHYVEKDEALVKFSISIMGNYIEVDKDKNVYYGRIEEDTNAEEGKYKASNLVHRTKLNSKDAINNIERFINNIDEIPEGYKAQMVALIKKAV